MLQIHAFDLNDRNKFARDTVALSMFKLTHILLEVQVEYSSF